VARVPQPVALEQHADPLAPLGDAVEAPVQLEVLERGQLAVDERVVADVAELPAVGLDLELALGRREQPGEEAEQRALPRPVAPGHEEEAAAREVEVDAREHLLLAEALAEPARRDHRARTSARTNAKKTVLTTPFIVKNAVFSLLQSLGETSDCS